MSNTTDAIDCPTCSGHGRFYDDSACADCSGTGVAKCHSCPSPATVPDLYTDGDGPACESCCTRCSCDSIATQLVKVTDDQGDCERDEAMCDRCADEESERAARIRRENKRQPLERGDAWAEVA